jgi:transposase
VSTFLDRIFSRDDSALAATVASMQKQLEEMDQQLKSKDQDLTNKDQQLKFAQQKIELLEEKLRLVRLRKYGKQSEKLSDLQLKLLDLEPGVSEEEVEAEANRGSLEGSDTTTGQGSGNTGKKEDKQKRSHRGRNELPAHLERIEKIIPCTPNQCTCGKCGKGMRVIGYETTEVLNVKPAEYFVEQIKREIRACEDKNCEAPTVQTAPVPERILPKSIFADEVIIDFVVNKYCDSLPLYRQQVILKRDVGIDVARSTINDSVLWVGELLIPIAGVMKQELLASGYIQADETPIKVQVRDKSGKNHQAYLWQYSSPGMGAVFDFQMSREGAWPKKFLGDYNGLLQTDGYTVYDSVGGPGVVHAGCHGHVRRKWIEAVKLDATDAASTRVVALEDKLFAIDREARDANMDLAQRDALRQERAPAILDALKKQLEEIRDQALPKSHVGKAAKYALVRWDQLTLFLKYPVLELSTNEAENSYRGIAIGRRNWLHLGSKEAGPKIAAIFSVVESCRRLNIPIRKYLADILPGLADRSIKTLPELTPAAYAARMAK